MNRRAHADEERSEPEGVPEDTRQWIIIKGTWMEMYYVLSPWMTRNGKECLGSRRTGTMVVVIE